jgi:hypothetical protein
VSVLDEILDGVRADLAARQQAVPLDQLKERTRRVPRPSMWWPRCAAMTLGFWPK